MGELIAVLSGKGGTGKTSVCAGIATALTKRGETVLCIDCDIGLRNLDIALGMREIPTLSFEEVIRDGYSLEQAAKHPVFPGLSFLTAPVHSRANEIDGFAFLDLLNRAREKFSYVLIDAPAGIDAGFALAARFADRILLVTGADPAAIRDAAKTAEVLETMGKNNVRLVVNRISKKMMSALGFTIDDIMDQAGVPLLGLVPEDPNVILSASFKQPLLYYTQKGAAAACLRIAKRIQGMSVPVKL